MISGGVAAPCPLERALLLLALRPARRYNPKAKILTMDPSVQGAGSQKSRPLVPWNEASVRRFCPHCTPANETALWKRGNVHFLRMYPDSAEALAIAARMVGAAKRVVVIEDSTHEYPVVLTNIKAYAKFVTPGSYMLVQDTRCGRWKPADAVETFLKIPEVTAMRARAPRLLTAAAARARRFSHALVPRANAPLIAVRCPLCAQGADFVVDPRWEYMVFSQHNGGWLRKKGVLEEYE